MRFFVSAAIFVFTACPAFGQLFDDVPSGGSQSDAYTSVTYGGTFDDDSDTNTSGSGYYGYNPAIASVTPIGSSTSADSSSNWGWTNVSGYSYLTAEVNTDDNTGGSNHQREALCDTQWQTTANESTIDFDVNFKITVTLKEAAFAEADDILNEGVKVKLEGPFGYRYEADMFRQGVLIRLRVRKYHNSSLLSTTYVPSVWQGYGSNTHKWTFNVTDGYVVYEDDTVRMTAKAEVGTSDTEEITVKAQANATWSN